MPKNKISLVQRYEYVTDVNIYGYVDDLYIETIDKNFK